MSKKNTLPTSLTRVTTFSKLLAVCIIFGFILAAFYAGIVFQQKYSSELLAVTPTPTQAPSEEIVCQKDSDCTLSDVSQSALCCPNTVCKDLSKDYVRAYSAKWLATRKQHLCSGTFCPMIMAMCTKEITLSNSHFSAKCVQNSCQKVRE